MCSVWPGNWIVFNLQHFLFAWLPLWIMNQRGVETDAVDGVLAGNRCLIHDLDPPFTMEFLRMLADAGVKSVKLPPRSPNLNAHAVRFVRSIKESCLDRMIFIGENSLRKAIGECPVV